MIKLIKRLLGLFKSREVPPSPPPRPPLPQETFELIARKSEGVPGTVILLTLAARMMATPSDFEIFCDLLPGSDEIWFDFEARAKKAKSLDKPYTQAQFIQEKAAEFNAL